MTLTDVAVPGMRRAAGQSFFGGAATAGGLPRSDDAGLTPPPRPAQVTRAGFVIWVPFWLAMGIGLWFGLAWEPGFGSYLLAILVLAAGGTGYRALPGLGDFGSWNERLTGWLTLGSLAVALVAAGFLAIGVRAHSVDAPILGFRYYGPIEGRVIGVDRSARDRVRITLDRVVLRNMPPGRTPARVRLSLMNDGPVPAPGEHLMLTGHLGPPPGPSEPGAFDFRRNAWFQGLGAVGYTRTPLMRVDAPQEGGLMALHRLRMQLSREIQARIGGQEGAVAAALMTGDRSGIAEATNESMRVSSLYHIISISGLHMTMLAGFVYLTLRLIGVGVMTLGAMLAGVGTGFPLHKLAALGALLASTAYLWLSGGGVATERAFVMVAVMLVAILLDRRAISLRTIAIAAIIVLVLTPESLTSPSFHMSFAATVALILLADSWRAAAPRMPRWVQAVLLLVLSSVVAGLASAPFAAAHFGRIAPYGLLANLLVVPVMGVFIMNMGVVAVLAVPFGLEGLPLWVMGKGVWWMLMISDWVVGLRGSDLLVPLPPGPVVGLIGIGLVLATLTRRRILRQGGLCLPAPLLSVGVALCLAALVSWARHDRPAVLISGTGDAVGVMTAEGRAVSKPSGGSFAIGNWLADDGDPADQRQAADRGAWSGPRNLRETRIGFGGASLRLLHGTGRFDAAAVLAACRPGTIIVLDSEFPTGPRTNPDCMVLDLPLLRQEGAMAIVADEDGAKLVSTAAWRGQRHWVPVPQRRVDLGLVDLSSVLAAGR